MDGTESRSTDPKDQSMLVDLIVNGSFYNPEAPHPIAFLEGDKSDLFMSTSLRAFIVYLSI